MKYVIANWKMNKSYDESTDYVSELLKDYLPNNNVKTIIAPPYIYIHNLIEMIKDTKISIASQNVYCENYGPFTGEISPLMLNKIGCEYTIIGHSERRKIFLEDNNVIYKKYIKSKENNIQPIVCFGEEYECYINNETISVIENQIDKFSNEKNVIFAYEPVWSIGTGLIPKIDEIRKSIDYVKNKISSASVLYGGSVNLENTDELLKIKELDGFLIGGASLDPIIFKKIILKTATI